MSKIVLVSNRLSVSVERTANGYSFTPSMGGLATGLVSLHRQEGSLWVGWSGIPSDELSGEDAEFIRRTLRHEYKSVAVDLSSTEIETFYEGFCNDTVWPLFHYFPEFASYDAGLWDAYRVVNEKFAGVLSTVLEDGDYLWIHDYQLMLLPALMKARFPDSKIGFFLHIPFPSYELFRMLPWRDELLRGLLGADLIGFHTFGYARHFLSSVLRILGTDHLLGMLKYENRMIRVDTFPMGIDYEKYAKAFQDPGMREEYERVSQQLGDMRLILSVDRLDYSKGIPMRLRAYHLFLEHNPGYHGKVQMVLIVAPSRTGVKHYQDLKREIDELVGITNGTFGTISWSPVSYFYRPVPFEQLVPLYSRAEVLLVTPLRDGMNLVSKEYIAVHTDLKGVTILSETAGSVHELSEALVVNPNDIDDIAGALETALVMPETEQEEKNRHMHDRLRRYDIEYWAHDFMDKLTAVEALQESFRVKRFTRKVAEQLLRDYTAGGRRLLLLDYDGTLVPSGEGVGRPDGGTLSSIAALAGDDRNDVVIISGREPEYIKKMLGAVPVSVVAGHGIWVREKGGAWQTTETLSGEWQETIFPVVELFRDRTPGTTIRTSEYSIVWSYRRALPELAAVRLAELKDSLYTLTMNLDLSILEGNGYLEIKDSRINKGRAVNRLMNGREWDFILAIGDDRTDEDVFINVPETAWTLKVGIDLSSARYFLDSVDAVRKLLFQLSEPGVIAGKS